MSHRLYYFNFSLPRRACRQAQGVKLLWMSLVACVSSYKSGRYHCGVLIDHRFSCFVGMAKAQTVSDTDALMLRRLRELYQAVKSTPPKAKTGKSRL